MSEILDQPFQAVADGTGLPVDRVRYVLLLFLSYPVAYIFRYVLHPSHTSHNTRYVFSMSLGLVMGFMCFGWQMFILFGVVGVSYIFLLVLPPNVVQIYTMVWAMGCMSAAHIYRMITDCGGYHLDFTGPLMLIVQRITLLGFAYHDGNARKESSLNDDQKKQKIDECPSLLVYFSYNFNFHSFLAGPTCTIKDYLAFMDGSNLNPPINPNAYARAKEHSKEPSSLYPVVTKLLHALFWVAVHILLYATYTSDSVLDSRHSFIYRLFVVNMYIFAIQSRYYFIWLITESINNASGLGFVGYDSKGDAKWDLVTNIFPWKVEFGLTMRAMINNWNFTAALWLRRIVFERVTFSPAISTFAVSALWHGFYPGYYISFITLILMLEASKKMRRHVRPYFQSNVVLHRIYDFITWAVTRFCLEFSMVPFHVMWVSSAVLFWSYYYFIPLILVLIVVFLFPSGKKPREKNSTTTPNSITHDETDNDKLKSD